MTNSRKLQLPDGLHVAPSILSADFACLADQVGVVLDAGAKVIHIDVMDGHFVPPITVGPLIVEAIADQVHEAGGFVDVHLMIERPERQIDYFCAAGADGVTVHYESTPNVHRALVQIKEAGCSAAVAINPATPADEVRELGGLIDMVLCMTVNPGWSGQKFIATSPKKVRRLAEYVGASVSIEVDGGISPATVPLVKKAGARIFVAGSAIFGAADPAAAYREIVAAAAA